MAIYSNRVTNVVPPLDIGVSYRDDHGALLFRKVRIQTIDGTDPVPVVTCFDLASQTERRLRLNQIEHFFDAHGDKIEPEPFLTFAATYSAHDAVEPPVPGSEPGQAPGSVDRWRRIGIRLFWAAMIASGLFTFVMAFDTTDIELSLFVFFAFAVPLVLLRLFVTWVAGKIRRR